MHVLFILLSDVMQLNLYKLADMYFGETSSTETETERSTDSAERTEHDLYEAREPPASVPSSRDDDDDDDEEGDELTEAEQLERLAAVRKRFEELQTQHQYLSLIHI